MMDVPTRRTRTIFSSAFELLNTPRVSGCKYGFHPSMFYVKLQILLKNCTGKKGILTGQTKGNAIVADFLSKEIIQLVDSKTVE